VSYGIYLFHLFGLYAAYRGLRSMGDCSVGTFFVVALLLSWAIAEVSFRTYESRFLALKDRVAGRWSRERTTSSPRGGDDGARTPGRASVHPSAVDA
jgi:peptidoglycan/LPS O-acetylase OafA/YrhL